MALNFRFQFLGPFLAGKWAWPPRRRLRVWGLNQKVGPRQDPLGHLLFQNYVPKLLDPGPLPLKRRSLHFVRHYKLQRAYIYDHLCNQSITHLFNFNGFGSNSNGRIAGDRNGRTHNSSWDCLLNIGSKVDGILKIF